MRYRNCSTCAYSEVHAYLDTFYCYNRDCWRHTSCDLREACDCIHWTSKKAFKSGRCSECRFSEYDAEEDTFTCHGKDTRMYIAPINDRERLDCSFCSPKPEEKFETKTTYFE